MEKEGSLSLLVCLFDLMFALFGCIAYTQYGPITNGGVTASPDSAILYRTILCGDLHSALHSQIFLKLSESYSQNLNNLATLYYQRQQIQISKKLVLKNDANMVDLHEVSLKFKYSEKATFFF